MLYTAGFFLRPCKKLKFQPAEGQLETVDRDPSDGSFTGRLEIRQLPTENLTEENSRIIQFLGNGYSTGARSLPPISLQMSLGLLMMAVVMNPLARVHLPRTIWMSLDVLVLILLGYALHLIREENAGNRPRFSLTRTLGQAPEFPFMSLYDVMDHIRRFWLVMLGGAFVLGLLGTQIGDGKFEDIHLADVAYNVLSALVCSAFFASIIMSITESIVTKGVSDRAQTNQVPGQFLITIFLLIFLSFVFGGHFTPVPEEERTSPAFNDRYDP